MPLPFIVIPCLFLIIYFFGATTKGSRLLKNALQWAGESWAKSREEYEQRWKEFERNLRSKDAIFAEIEGFKAFRTVFSANNMTAIAIDSRSEKVCLMQNPSAVFPCDLRQVQFKVLPYSGILEAALHEDGNTITRTSRSSQLVGAVVGNALLGGVGLAIGAVTGSKKSTGTVRQLEIRLTIKDMDCPYWAFSFLRVEAHKNSREYKMASDNANGFLSLVKVLIDQSS